MDCSQIAEQEVADRYVLGQLDAEEAERFEDHYMSCNRCAEGLERAEVLARGFKHLAAEELAKIQVAGTTIAWWRQRKFWFSAGTAAAVAVLAMPFLTHNPTISPTASNRVNTPVIYLQPERSAAAAPGRQLASPIDGGPLIVVLELDPPFYDTYRVTVESLEGPVWSTQGLKLGERESLTLSLASDLLTPGDYRLRLETESGQGQPISVGLFTFRILADLSRTP